MSEVPTLTLSPNDPFDRALIPIVSTYRRKRLDYARDDDPFSNFRATADLLGLDGFGAVEAALFNVFQKLVRIQTLRANGRLDATANEPVMDSYLDLAAYAILTYAIAQSQASDQRPAPLSPESAHG